MFLYDEKYLFLENLIHPAVHVEAGQRLQSEIERVGRGSWPVSVVAHPNNSFRNLVNMSTVINLKETYDKKNIYITLYPAHSRLAEET